MTECKLPENFSRRDIFSYARYKDFIFVCSCLSNVLVSGKVAASIMSASRYLGVSQSGKDSVLLNQGYLSAPLVRTSGYGADNPISNSSGIFAVLFETHFLHLFHM